MLTPDTAARPPEAAGPVGRADAASAAAGPGCESEHRGRHASGRPVSARSCLVGGALAAAMVIYALIVYVLSPRSGLAGFGLTAVAMVLAGAAMLWVWLQWARLTVLLKQAKAASRAGDTQGAQGRPGAGIDALSVGLTASSHYPAVLALERVEARLVEIQAALHERSAPPPPVVPQLTIGVLISIAHCVQVPLLRALEQLGRVERQVEDPDLLDPLYMIDHEVTQARRQVERLAVLGGETARRVRTPMLVGTLLREAVTAVESFSRVRVAQQPAAPVAVHGSAGPDVILLLAELIDNATLCSPPDTQVRVRASETPGGLAIEIADQGLPMSEEKSAAMNRLLAEPLGADVPDLLRRGRFGLLVVGLLARRYDIRVRLRNGEGGGTRACVLLPPTLVVSDGVAAAASSRSSAPGAATTSGLNRSGPPVGSSRAATRSVPPAGRAGPSVVAQAAAPHPDQAPGRPALPQRGAANPPQESDPHLSPGRPAPGRANPGLMAAFTQGRRRAAPPPAQPPGPNHPPG